MSIAETVLEVVFIMMHNTLKYPSILILQHEEWGNKTKKFPLQILAQNRIFPKFSHYHTQKKTLIFLSFVFAPLFEFCLLIILVHYFHVYFNLQTNGHWSTAIAQQNRKSIHSNTEIRVNRGKLVFETGSFKPSLCNSFLIKV